MNYLVDCVYDRTLERFLEQTKKTFVFLLKASLAVVGVGITYYMTKRLVPSIGQTEGSSELPASRRAVEIRGPKAKFNSHAFRAVSVQGQTLSSQEIIAQMAPGSASVLMHNIRPNIGILSSIRGNVNVIGLCDHKIAFVEHAVSQNTELLTAVFPGGLSYHFSLAQVQHVLCSDNHLYIVDLASIKENRQRRSFSNIIKYFIIERNDDFDYDGFVFVAVNLSSVLTHIV